MAYDTGNDFHNRIVLFFLGEGPSPSYGASYVFIVGFGKVTRKYKNRHCFIEEQILGSDKLASSDFFFRGQLSIA